MATFRRARLRGDTGRHVHAVLKTSRHVTEDNVHAVAPPAARGPPATPRLRPSAPAASRHPANGRPPLVRPLATPRPLRPLPHDRPGFLARLAECGQGPLPEWEKTVQVPIRRWSEGRLNSTVIIKCCQARSSLVAATERNEGPSLHDD